MSTRPSLVRICNILKGYAVTYVDETEEAVDDDVIQRLAHNEIELLEDFIIYLNVVKEDLEDSGK